MLVVLCLAILSSLTVAHDASSIVARYRKAIGNAAKLEQLRSCSIEGIVTSSDGSWQRSYRAWCMGDNVRTEIVIQPGITATSWINGLQGWTIQPWSYSLDPQPMNETMVFRLRCFSKILVNDLLNNPNKLQFNGTDDIDGSDCFKLQCRHSDGSLWTYYIDPDAFLPVKLSVEATIGGEPLEWEMSYSDYRTVDGVLLPTVLTSSGSTIIVKRYALNPLLEESLFAPPAK